MFKFFRKKPKTLEQYLEIVDKNQKLQFQINVFVKIKKVRQKRYDLQIFRQDIMSDFNLSIVDVNGYLLMMTFNDEQYENEKHYERFKSSNLFNISHFIDMYGKTYLITCKNKEILLEQAHFILENIYGYTENTFYYIEFEKLGNRKL